MLPDFIISFKRRHCNTLLKIVAFVLLSMVSLPVFCQLKLYGKLVDSLTNEPVAGATIYADQTQLITASDTRGFFRLNGITPNTTIIVTHTGYEKARAYPGHAGDTLVIRLLRKAVSLENVILDPDAKRNSYNTWNRWGNLFTSVLIGENMEKECLLLNPEDVRFEYDRKKMVLKARARNTLHVENRMLGYLLHIDLDSLVYSIDRGNVLYVMSAYFEMKEEKDVSLQKMMAANRLRAFRGSRMHFARALYQKKLLEEGFHLYQYKGTLNEEKSRVERLLLATLAERNDPNLKETGNKIDLSVFGKDSARYYKKVLEQPACYFEDSLPVFFNARWREGSATAIFYMGSDSLLLVYKEVKGRTLPDNELRKWASLKEPLSSLYSSADFLKAGTRREKYSLLHLLSGSQIAIRQNGYVEESSSLFMEGYLAGNRLGHDLPWDYAPATDEQRLLDEQQAFTTAASRMIGNNWERMTANHSSSELYLHLDKTIYDTGENIWFAAYMLRSPFKPQEHHTLFVTLQNPDTKQVMASEKFVMEYGIGAGYLFLPDSFPPGTYHLLAYTNTLPEEKNPVVFDQAIVIRPLVYPVSVQYDGAASRYSNDSVSVVCRVKNENGQPAAGTEVAYRLTVSGETLVTGTAMTNEKGELAVQAVSLKKTAGGRLMLHTAIRHAGVSVQLKNDITLPGKYLKVRWYPEGGTLVNGITSRLAYEVRDANGQPSDVTLNLFKGSQLACTLNADGSGAGTIELTPASGYNYSLALLTDSLVITENNFPVVQEEGYALYADKGVVTDSLRLYIRSTKKRDALYVMIHDFKNQYYFDKVPVTDNEKRFSLSSDKLPDGLIAITLFDDEAKPVAERTVFKEPPGRPVLSISLDSTLYHTRSKVQLKLKATDGEGNPLRAVVSLACVLNSRIDSSRFQDIVPFSYFNNYKAAGAITTRPDYFQYRKDQLEKFLLIQCWTKYKWQDGGDLPVEMKTSQYSLVQRGQVYYKGGRPHEPAEVMLVTPEKLLTIKTDSSGYFELDQSLLTTLPDWRLTLAVNAKYQGDYTLLLTDDNVQLQQQLARADYPEPQRTRYISAEEKTPFMKTLAPVTVFSKNENKAADALKIFRRAISKGEAECVDYVCYEGHLNCQSHPTGTKPIVGRVYQFLTPCGFIRFTYNQCWEGGAFIPLEVKPSTDTVVYQLKGRYYTKEFYSPDYEKYSPPFAEWRTTLFWNPLIQTDEKGEASFSFFTNDLTGRLALIAEGMGAGLPLSAKKVFVVKNR